MEITNLERILNPLLITKSKLPLGYASNFFIGLSMAMVGVHTVVAATFNSNQQAVANALNACDSQSTSDITSPLCIARLSSENIKSLNPDQIFAMGSMAARVNGGKVTQINKNYSSRYEAKIGGAAGNEDFSPLSLWWEMDSNFGDRNTTPKITGFGVDNHNFVSGVDYRVEDNWVVGGLFSYRHNNALFDSGRGETMNDSYTGGLYTTYNITDALHIDASASYGGFVYETTRNINLIGLGSSVAQGSTSGGQYAFSGGSGYDFNFQALSIAPYVRGEYMNLSIDGFSESGSLAAVQFANQNIESLVSTMGIQTSYTLSFPWGILTPQLRGEWHHQYLDGRRNIDTRFTSDPSAQRFTMVSGVPVRDYFTVGAEVSSLLPGGVSAFLSYETLQGYTDISSHKFMLGTRFEF